MKTGRNKLIECYNGFYIWCSRNTFIIRNYYCSLLLTSRYEDEDIRVRNSMKTSIAQPFVLSKPVWSFFFFFNPLQFSYTHPCMHLLKLCFLFLFPFVCSDWTAGSFFVARATGWGLCLAHRTVLLVHLQEAPCGSPRMSPITLRHVLTCLLSSLTPVFEVLHQLIFLKCF